MNKPVDLEDVRKAKSKAASFSDVGDLQQAADLLADDFPELKFNKLTGAFDGDVTIAVARLALEQRLHKTPKRDLVSDAIEIAARTRSYDPLADHINSLPEWDGEERMKNWLIRFAGAKNTDFVRQTGEKWLIGAIARALQPGCKMDCLLALVSRQGVQKSTAFSIIGGDFYKSNLNVTDLHGKESRQEIRGSWIIELPELSTLRRSDIDASKGFLSESTDKYRPSYGRALISVPRRCVFCGTVNKDRPFISDPEVQRRYWIVEVNRVDIEALRLERDQLLSEARAAFLAGDPWWFDDAGDEWFREAMTEAQDQCRVFDPWTPMIERWLDGNRPDAVTTGQLLQDMGVPIAQITKAAEMRAADILKDLGWSKQQCRRNGRKAVWWSK